MRATAAHPAPPPSLPPPAEESPPHAPEESWATRLLGPVRVTGIFWYRIHRFGMRVVPEWALPGLIFLFTALFWVVLRRIRAAIASNLEPVLGPCGFWERQRRMFRTFHQYAWCLSERYERLTTAPPVAIEADHPERWQRALAAGRGVILLTGHLGSWEIGSALAGGAERRPVHVVREEETDPRAQAFIARLLAERMGPGYHTHFAAGADPGLSMALLAALGRGEVVALQGDRPRRGGKTLRLPLFGRTHDFPAGPLVLARTAGVPLVPVFVLREGRRAYRALVGEPITVAHSADRAADLAAAGARVAAAVEGAIRSRPHQWFCFRRLWPAGKDAP
jgi:KDO2-lipid IV(A) lauroyltransferase